MPHRAACLKMVLGVLAAAGCSSAVRKPQLLHPGPAPFQRGNAEVIDPYPLPDMGPEIVGGRPREFDQPRNEVVRAQQYKRSRGQAPGADLPLGPIPVGQPLPVSQPYAPPYSPPAYPAQPAPAGPRY